MDGISKNTLNFTCCFCNTGIEAINSDPCDINIMCNFGKENEDPESQSFYCHHKCFKEKLHDSIKGYFIIGEDDE